MKLRAICLNIGDRIQVPGLWGDSEVTGVRSYWRKHQRICEVHLDNHAPVLMRITDCVVVINRGQK